MKHNHNHIWNHVRMGAMETSKSVMEKSWNSVFRFLWEPCHWSITLSNAASQEFETMQWWHDHLHLPSGVTTPGVGPTMGVAWLDALIFIAHLRTTGRNPAIPDYAVWTHWSAFLLFRSRPIWVFTFPQRGCHGTNCWQLYPGACPAWLISRCTKWRPCFHHIHVVLMTLFSSHVSAHDLVFITYMSVLMLQLKCETEAFLTCWSGTGWGKVKNTLFQCQALPQSPGGSRSVGTFMQWVTVMNSGIIKELETERVDTQGLLRGHWGSLNGKFFCQAFVTQYWWLTKHKELEGSDHQGTSRDQVVGAGCPLFLSQALWYHQDFDIFTAFHCHMTSQMEPLGHCDADCVQLLMMVAPLMKKSWY